MSNRLNQEREVRLQPDRVKYAIGKIQALGFEISRKDNTRIQFTYKGNVVTFFPYSGWHTGKGIKDGRGIEKLIKQLNP